MKNILVTFLPLVLFSVFASANDTNYLQFLQNIPLPNVTGRIDHMGIDLKNDRLLVAALGNNTLEIIDLKISKRVHTIKGLDEPQGVLFIPGDNTIVVSNGGTGKCSIFDANSFELIRSIRLGDDADNVRYDPNTRLIYVGYGSGAIGVMDKSLLGQKGNVELPGHPEAFQLEKTGNRMFVNIPPRQIAVINRKNMVLERFIEIKDTRDNFPMALDETSQQLFVGCRNPARLVILSIRSGAEICHLDIDKDTDDIFWDSANKRIYVSCGGGFIDVIRQVDPDKYVLAERIPTEPGARTSLFVPERGIICLAVPAKSGHPAEIRIYKIP